MIFGHAEAWCKDHGKVIEFESRAEAEKYASEPAVIIKCWQMLAIQILIYIGTATIALEFIDKDKR